MHDAQHREPASVFDLDSSRKGLNKPSGSVLVAIPLYRSPELLQPLVHALADIASELRQLCASILFINDSPDDDELQAAIEAAVAELGKWIDVDHIANDRNMGFVFTANRAMMFALATDRDIILLNSDALPQPGAFAEMMSVAYLDPLVSVVSPRSNNATICNSPAAEALRAKGAEDAYRAHKGLHRYLPRFSYVPTAVGFCLLVRRAMLAEFGFFDPIYGEGYNEENDFIRRCNQRGYRAVLANHAYVVHLGEASFSKTSTSRSERQAENHALLVARYPEYETIIERHFASAEFRAEYVTGGLIAIEGKLRIVFDCRVLGVFYNGTFEHIRRLLAAFTRLFSDRYDIRILCDAAAFRFHRLDLIEGLRACDAEQAKREPSAIAFRLSQPDTAAAASLADYAPITGALVLDTISMDCEQLDDLDLHALWQNMADNLDLIGFNSAFSNAQFKRRFDIPERTLQFVSPCSMDPADYSPEVDHIGGGGILLIGNQYPHKHMREMVAALRAAGTSLPIVSFGLKIDEPGIEASYGAGHISEETVERLYRQADVALFPSHYEGFGLPIMHALARRLPIIARDIPCAREIKEGSPFGRNLYLCASTEDMARLAANPPVWQDSTKSMVSTKISWETSAWTLMEAFEQAIDRFEFSTCRRHQAAAMAVRRQSAGAAAEAARGPLEDGVRLGQEGIRSLRQRLAASELRAVSAEQMLATTRRRAADAARRAIDADILAAVASSSLEHVRHRNACVEGAIDVVNAMASVVSYDKSRSPRFWRALSDEILLRFARKWSLDAPVPFRLQNWGVRLTSDADDIGFVRNQLIRWAVKMSIGEPLRIRINKHALGDRREKAEMRRAIHALFAVAGCSVRRISYLKRDIAITGTKIAQWTSPPPMRDTQAVIDFGYRVLLGREPDEGGLQHYREALAQGAPMDEVLLDIAGSDERWNRTLSLCSESTP
jgi:GT2 family glycosyltransferase